VKEGLELEQLSGFVTCAYKRMSILIVDQENAGSQLAPYIGLAILTTAVSDI